MEILTEGYSGKRIKGVRAAPVSTKSDKIIDANAVSMRKITKLLTQRKVYNGFPTDVFILGSKHQYYMKLLINTHKLHDMSMMILSQVLLYLNSVDDNVSPDNFEKQIEPYINALIGKNFNDRDNKLLDISNVSSKNYDIIRLRTYLEFYRYTRFMQLLIDDVEHMGDLAEKRDAIEEENIDTPHTDYGMY